MRPRRILTSMAFVVITLLLCSTAPDATAATREPVVDGIIRDGGPFGPKDGIGDVVLDGSVVQTLHVPSFEDRGIIEFNLAGLSQPILNVELVLPVFSSNPFPFTIAVFGYAGDGALTVSDWDQGSLLTSFLYSGEQTVTLDVTSFIRSAVAAGDEFAGFNFRVAGPPIIGPFVAFGSLDFPPSAFLRINESSSVISIDIRLPDSINRKSKGKVPVAILTTASFDATTVDPSTVRFGVTGTEAAPVHFALEDVDGDGDIDMVLHFNTQDTGIECGVTSVLLVGETVSGQVIAGSDSIKTVGCK
jgi:hypothetical protein